MKFPHALTRIISQFHKLPGIGLKTAQRLSIHLLKQEEENLEQFSEALLLLKKEIKMCVCCYNICDEEKCSICLDPKRETEILCIVSEPLDIIALEKSRVFQGRYHVLHGAISPMDNVSPDDLKISELFSRIERENISEIILATNPTLEGEATALYISKKLEHFRIKVTRIAKGVPMGTDIEYADEVTLMNAISGRVRY